jgi:hypothetical protein
MTKGKSEEVEKWRNFMKRNCSDRGKKANETSKTGRNATLASER